MKMREWRRNNPDKVRIIHARYRANYYKASGSHTVDEWKKIKKVYKNLCAWCGRKEPFEDLKFRFLTLDHIMPLSRGGTNDKTNIQPLCFSCNCKKSDAILDINLKNTLSTYKGF